MPREPVARRRTAARDVEEGAGLDEFKEGVGRVVKEVAGDSVIGSGWSSDRKTPVIRRSGQGPERFEKIVPDGGTEVLVKFVEDSPFASYWQHWVQAGKKRRPYVCIIDDCPLCSLGLVPKPVDVINVIALEQDKDGNVTPKVYAWSMSADPAKAVRARAENKRTSPINKDQFYWAVSKETGDNGFNTYHVDLVKAADLQDDYGIDPLTDAVVAELSSKGYTEADVAQRSTKRELQEVADGLED